MSKPGIETYNEDGQWKSRRQGNERAFAVGGTKAEQVAEGREAAQRDKVEHTLKNDKVEHTIKNVDGTIGRKNSHGNDPHPPKG